MWPRAWLTMVVVDGDDILPGQGAVTWLVACGRRQKWGQASKLRGGRWFWGCWFWGDTLENAFFGWGVFVLGRRNSLARQELWKSSQVSLLGISCSHLLSPFFHFPPSLFGVLFVCLVMDNRSYAWVLLISSLFIYPLIASFTILLNIGLNPMKFCFILLYVKILLVIFSFGPVGTLPTHPSPLKEH